MKTVRAVDLQCVTGLNGQGWTSFAVRVLCERSNRVQSIVSTRELNHHQDRFVVRLRSRDTRLEKEFRDCCPKRDNRRCPDCLREKAATGGHDWNFRKLLGEMELRDSAHGVDEFSDALRLISSRRFHDIDQPGARCAVKRNSEQLFVEPGDEFVGS